MDPAPRLRAIRQPPSLVEMITEELRQRIVEGVYAPDERLREARVASDFGVSRPPVREAMRLLQREGLLTVHPRRGVSVTALTAADVREIYAVRHALEELAVKLAVPVRDEAQLDPLRQAVREMASAAADGRRGELPLINLRFHQALARLPGNGRLARAYDDLAGQLEICMAMNLKLRERLVGDLGESVQRHAELLRLIELGDIAAVVQALEKHGDRSLLDSLDDAFPRHVQA